MKNIINYIDAQIKDTNSMEYYNEQTQEMKDYNLAKIAIKSEIIALNKLKLTIIKNNLSTI